MEISWNFVSPKSGNPETLLLWQLYWNMQSIVHQVYLLQTAEKFIWICRNVILLL